MLSVIVSDVKVGESTLAFLRKATQILDKLALTAEEKDASGYVTDNEGRTAWKKDIEVSIPFEDSEWVFLARRVAEYGNWPVAAAKQSFALADKFS